MCTFYCCKCFFFLINTNVFWRSAFPSYLHSSSHIHVSINTSVLNHMPHRECLTAWALRLNTDLSIFPSTFSSPLSLRKLHHMDFQCSGPEKDEEVSSRLVWFIRSSNGTPPGAGMLQTVDYSIYKAPQGKCGEIWGLLCFLWTLSLCFQTSVCKSRICSALLHQSVTVLSVKHKQRDPGDPFRDTSCLFFFFFFRLTGLAGGNWNHKSGFLFTVQPS